MAVKRKRKTSVAEEEEDVNNSTPSTTAEESSDAKSPPIAENPFQVRVQPYIAALKAQPTPSKSSSKWSNIHQQNPLNTGGPKCMYQISPVNKWNEMKKYNKFVITEKQFGIGDYVFIYHGDQVASTHLDPAARSCWVAQVLEIRAVDSTRVFLRVFWMYWPEEVPISGRKDYHGAGELIASNHMDIVDAMTVTDRAEVQHLKETSSTLVEELYWRQTYDVVANKLTNLRKECYCDGYYNPDKLVIQCPECNANMHEACLLRDACSRAWIQEQEAERFSEVERQLQLETSASDIKTTIPDSQRTNGTGAPSSYSRIPSPPLPLPLQDQSSPTKSTTKKRKSQVSPKSDPWEGKMKAHLEMKEEDGEELPEATGMATVCYDPIDEPSRNLRVGLRCLMPKCRKWLYEESGGPESIKLVKEED